MKNEEKYMEIETGRIKKKDLKEFFSKKNGSNWG